MVTRETEAFATRLPEDEAKLVKQIVEETDQTEAEILRRMMRFYLRYNPDEIPVLYPEGSIQRMLAEDFL
jgi:hypothetical protein